MYFVIFAVRNSTILRYTVSSAR